MKGAVRVFVLLVGLVVGVAGSEEGSFLDVDGGRLYYEVRGAGPTVVLLHDSLIPSATWDEQVGVWSRRHRVVRYDRRAYGSSSVPTASYSDLDDLAALFDALEIESAALVGAADGGRLAIDFTLVHPERVDALVLVSAVVGGAEYSAHFLARVLRNRGPLIKDRDAERSVELWAADPYLTAAGSSAVRGRLPELLDVRIGLEELSREPAFSALERLGEIRVDTLIVVGESDIPDVHAQAGILEAGIDGARRVVLPGAGHLVHLEQPGPFNELALDFLAPAAERAEILLADVERLDAEDLLALFDYDAGAPLEVEEAGRERRGDVTVVDLSYASPKGGRVTTYLVLPPGPGPFPAVLFLHPGQGDRATFVDEAVELAGLGVVSLAIDAPYRRPGYQADPELFGAEEARRSSIQIVIDLRRAVDLLIARRDVDADRIAYVGHSLGASIGGVFAGLEPRLAGWVLMAGYPSVTHSFLKGGHTFQLAFRTLLSPEQQARYVELTLPFDAVHWMPRATGPMLLQFARRDEFITEADALAYLQIAPRPKEIRWYDTDHFFDERAREDRLSWLRQLLQLE